MSNIAYTTKPKVKGAATRKLRLTQSILRATERTLSEQRNGISLE